MSLSTHSPWDLQLGINFCAPNHTVLTIIRIVHTVYTVLCDSRTHIPIGTAVVACVEEICCLDEIQNSG
jgi:hypothetical protein